jgi:hypothetical protein
MGIAALELGIGFASRDEESSVAMDAMKSGEIQIAPVHDVGSSGFDVAQTLPISELSKRHHQELFVAGQRFGVSVALVPLHALAEFVPRQPVHHLGKDNPAFVHNRVPPDKIREKYHTKAECH